MKKLNGQHMQGLLTIMNFILVNALFVVAGYMVFGMSTFGSRTLRTLWMLINTAYFPAMLIVRPLRHSLRHILLDKAFLNSFKTILLHAVIFMSLLSFLHIEIKRSFYLIFYGSAFVIMPIANIMALYFVKKRRRSGRNYSRVVIVGTHGTAQRLAEQLQSDEGFGYRLLGFFDDDPRVDFKGVYLGHVDKLEAYVRTHKVDEIYYTMRGERNGDLLTNVAKVADDNMISFYYVPQISHRLASKFQLNTIGTMPVLNMRPNPLAAGWNRFVKRSFDIAFSSVVLLFSPIVFVPVAIAIKLSSPGPIFFKQQRTGYMGKSFYCYKFRTMRVNAAADKQQATKDDPRKTRVGNFLRKTSIDELPQFINVWLGDMSVVGPRPHMLTHTSLYTKLIAQYMVRHAVKPGISGWAQVNGYRGLTDELWKMEKRVEHDVWYIENWSFALDLKIIVRTVINAAGGEKNAF